MNIQVSSEILDGLVLSLLTHQDFYGYAITQKVQESIKISESTMYPVLRRLRNKKWLTTYDQPYQGRNRRYYKITEAGIDQLKIILEAWQSYQTNLNQVFEETQIPPINMQEDATHE
ncbi:PadR family transcriptional regulator [Pediococcus parvulus]|uniref:PadR family transcriptional regulator n=1 Tax=Pediococcus parvulus TaxID=54062 RepID=A0AAP5TAF6_9LACO|nr:PadR family transcriptional regulator [Pediococcus parvulus]MDV7694169.1 PadR family transcriptional regulator [Pediococcus parvulus]OAD63109.1 PadR family transcriptional regulator [Pediococcus parvulus]